MQEKLTFLDVHYATSYTVQVYMEGGKGSKRKG